MRRVLLAALAALSFTSAAAADTLPHRVVDTSQFNGCAADWPLVKRAGFDTVIMRAAYVGNGSVGHDLYRDACFTAKQVAAVRRSGLRVGVYIYSIPRAGAAASRDASFLWRVAKQAGYGVAGDVKPVNDEEQSDYGASINTRWAQAFGFYFRNQGSAIYTSCCILSWTSSYINLPLWVANYSGFPALPPFARTWQLWQYSQTGRVAGLPGDADLSRARPTGALHILLR